MSYYFVYAGNAIRQALALPIGLIAFCLYLDRRYWKAALLITLAIGLHWSAIFYLIASVFAFPLFKRHWVFIVVPLVMLILSVFIGEVARIFVDLLGMPELKVKYEIYFEGGRESHVGVIWTKFNFWISIIVSFVFLVLCKPSRYESNVLHLYVLLFLSLTLFGVMAADFSERFLPALLLVLPLVAVQILRRFKIPASVAEGVLIQGFFALWVLIIFSQSSIETLGYKL